MIKAPFVRSPYNYDMSSAGDESGLKCRDPSLTVQDQRDEVDINTIIRRFGIGGPAPANVRAPMYGDFSEVTDFQSAMQAVIDAEASFMQMTPEVRARFQNDPGAFVDFCSKDENVDEMRRLGLCRPEDVPPPAPVVRFHEDDLKRLIPRDYREKPSEPLPWDTDVKRK